MYKEKIINTITGEETWRDYTPTEIADVEKAQLEAAIKSQAEAESAAKKAEAEAKLIALGLTAEDLKSLGIGGN